MTRKEEPSQERLVAAAAAVSVPRAVRNVFEAPVEADPGPGEVWRAAWRETVELLLIVDSTKGMVLAAPLTLEQDYADEESVVLPPNASPLGVAAVVWLGLARWLPVRVVDRKIARLAVEAPVQHSAERLVVAGRAHRGRASVSAVDPLAEYRAMLRKTSGKSLPPRGGHRRETVSSAVSSPRQALVSRNWPNCSASRCSGRWRYIAVRPR